MDRSGELIYSIRVHDIEKKYYADGEDAYAMRLTLKEPKKKQPLRGVVEEVNQVAAAAAATAEAK